VPIAFGCRPMHRGDVGEAAAFLPDLDRKDSMKIARGVMAAMSMLCGSAFAQVHIGGAIGFTNSNIDCHGTSACDRVATGFKLSAGYAFSPNIVGEVNYLDLGKVQAHATVKGVDYRADIKGSAVGAGLALHAAITPQWKGIVRFGISSNTTQLGLIGNNATRGQTETHTTGYGGLAVGYCVDRNTTVEGGVDFSRVKYAAQSADVRLTTVGITYAF